MSCNHDCEKRAHGLGLQKWDSFLLLSCKLNHSKRINLLHSPCTVRVLIRVSGLPHDSNVTELLSLEVPSELKFCPKRMRSLLSSRTDAWKGLGG